MPGLERRFEHDGVEALRTGRFAAAISTTCILYRIADTVIDTGPPNQWSLVRTFLRERTVQRVLVTHHHEDHSGNGARVRREMDASVFVPARGVALVRDGFRLRTFQKIIWGIPDRFEAEPVPDEIQLAEGMTVWALHTPGHSVDSTCYLERNRGWLFAGDLYLGRLRYLRADESVDLHIRSLTGILTEDFDTVFCAHRGVLVHGKDALRRKLDHLMSLRQHVRDLHAQGYPVREIQRRLLGREGLLAYASEFQLSKRNLIRGCLPPGAPERLDSGGPDTDAWTRS